MLGQGAGFKGPFDGQRFFSAAPAPDLRVGARGLSSAAMRAALPAFALVVALAGAAGAETRVFYSPATDLRAVDVAAIDAAVARIDFAAYALTDKAIVAALARAAGRGVAVRVYLDPRQRLDAPMDSLPPGVAVRVKGGGALMHLKGYAVDGRLLRLGSANFSRAGLRRQDNSIELIDDASAVAQFEREFETMWGR